MKPFYAPYSTREVLEAIEQAYERYGSRLWTVMGTRPGWGKDGFDYWLSGLDREGTIAAFTIALRVRPTR